MPHLVDGLLLGSIEITLLVKGVFLEESPYLVPRFEEPVVADVVVFVGSEFGLQ
jgi:hypothetical protein